MERKSPFIDGFYKAASLEAAGKALNSFKNKLLLAGVVGGSAYGAGKLISSAEDPEQKRIRQLSKMKALPYQQRVEV